MGALLGGELRRGALLRDGALRLGGALLRGGEGRRGALLRGGEDRRGALLRLGEDVRRGMLLAGLELLDGLRVGAGRERLGGLLYDEPHEGLEAAGVRRGDVVALPLVRTGAGLERGASKAGADGVVRRGAEALGIEPSVVELVRRTAGLVRVARGSMMVTRLPPAVV